MIVTLNLGGVPVTATVEVHEPAQTGTVQAAVKALSTYANYTSGKITLSDLKTQWAGIKLTGKGDT